MLHERLNVADTVKVPWQAYPTAGHPLLSDQGRLLATIVADTSGTPRRPDRHHHAGRNTARYGDGTRPQRLARRARTADPGRR